MSGELLRYLSWICRIAVALLPASLLLSGRGVPRRRHRGRTGRATAAREIYVELRQPSRRYRQRRRVRFRGLAG
jgi:hypothetical protein